MATPPAKKVLVVEDNELNMKLFCDLLDAFGYKTVESRDGLKAVDLAREHKPDLIIMDIQLPEVSGLDLTRWIKDDQAINQIPIMAVTAFAMRQDERLVREALGPAMRVECEPADAIPLSAAGKLQVVVNRATARRAGAG